MHWMVALTAPAMLTGMARHSAFCCWGGFIWIFRMLLFQMVAPILTGFSQIKSGKNLIFTSEIKNARLMV